RFTMTSPLWERLRLSCAPDHKSGRIRYRIRDQRRLFRLDPLAPWIALHCGGRRGRDGFGSALVMALTRAYVRSFAALGLEVDEILTLLNRMLVQDLSDGFSSRWLSLHWIYATVPWSTQSPDTSPAIFCGSRARWSVRWKAPVCLSVFFPEVRYSRTCTSQLHAGQTIVLSTDGVTESNSPGGNEMGTGRALECVRQPSRIQRERHHRESLPYGARIRIRRRAE